MAEEFKSGFCKECDENRKVARNKPRHILHLCLTVVTGGLWLIVWILVSIRFGGWRCNYCGSKKVKNVH